MLEQLKLEKFRCFKDYTIEFDKFNIIVGKNDAGKSTIIDTLKLISNARRYASYRDFYLEERDIPFSAINLQHNYTEEDVIINSKFSDKTRIQITFPKHERPNVQYYKESMPIAQRFRQSFKHSIGIIPPVGTFEEYEKLGDSKYLSSVLISHLTPRHFRNIWYYFNEEFEEFQAIIEETWPGYSIKPPEFNYFDNRVNMFFSENGIDREIFWAGHGFQIWLQLMTFLVKLGNMETLVLDEPDIYLHSDMQKKLINICRERSNQLIIATHAVDIIEEVDPDDIISIEKSLDTSRRLSSIDEVQTCINQLGSCQNLKLIHFIRGKACLFLEGHEFRYLKKVAKKFNIEPFIKEDGFSVIELGGFSNWEWLKNVNWIFKNAFGEKIKCYAILDRDYYTIQEIDEIKSNLQQKDVKVHIWDRKEIENYAINLDALYRMFVDKFNNRYNNSEIPLSEDDFKKRILSILEDFKDDVQAQIITRKADKRKNRSVDKTTIVSEALREFSENWGNIEYRLNVIPGKEFFKKLNTWLSDEYRIAISIDYAFHFLQPEEINSEIQVVIDDFIQLVNS